ncbi:hypothetical protein EX011_21430 [Salmonella enterica]|nr:hypothetical protein [Salmonella enterica]
MQLVADNQGRISGTIPIPANTYKAGTKAIEFKGDPNKPNPSQQSHAEGTFTGQGTVVTNTMRQVQNIMQSYYDPLAQTFMLNEARQLSGINIWVVTKGTTPLIVQLRETSVGFPTRVIIAEGRLDPTDAGYVAGQFCQVKFDVPFYASANVEYAVVVLANDSATEVGISELGKLDTTTNSYVTSQPYQIGVLLSSANASTWTAHQDKDLTFQLLARRYTGQPKQIGLGEMTIKQGTTDLLISALTSTPATFADADLLLRFYDPVTNQVASERNVSDGQVVKLSTALGADTRVEVLANLRCTQYASATIEPGTQIIAGTMETTGDYITRDIPADAHAETDLTVTLEASANTSNISVWYAEAKPNTAIQPGDWKKLYQDANENIQLDTGRLEMQFRNPRAADANSDPNKGPIVVASKIGMMANLKLKVSLGGTADQRPQVFNLRASIV